MGGSNHASSSSLDGHPIFSLPNSFRGPIAQSTSLLELSTNTLPAFTNIKPLDDGPTPSGRRRTMVLKDADLIVAAGREVRMSVLADACGNEQSYKTLHTPNMQFDIHEIQLNPTGKLLAIAGAFQVAVIVLPRTGYSRLVSQTIDCKSVQIGQFYHGTRSAAPIAKIQWHPWGEAGSTLMVMTIDGKLREYDISVDTEEPQQIVPFVPERKGKSFIGEDPSDREVASFSLGNGSADWGPLTIYAVMKSGNIYALCPYMPRHATIPSSYVHSLECFVAAKQEFLSQSTPSEDLSTMYDHQQKYISSLVRQLPEGTVYPSVSRSIPMHPPTTIKSSPARQGPFLLQPAPRTLDNVEMGDATDITYLSFGYGVDDESESGDTEHMGVVLVAYLDGRVDVCLDVEKVEARWKSKKSNNTDLPMLAVYETIDLGLAHMLFTLNSFTDGHSPLDLLQGNHPVFFADPIHNDIVYVYHAFGVHSLRLEPLLSRLASALKSTDDDASNSALISALENPTETLVTPILLTYSVERKCSNPVIAVAIPDDVYLTYSIFILTSAMRITSFVLNLDTESSIVELSKPASATPPTTTTDPWLIPADGPSPFVSLLAQEPYVIPTILSSPTSLPSNPTLSVPASGELRLTPDTLRYLGTTVGRLTEQCQEVQLAQKSTEMRVSIQSHEIGRLCTRCKDMYNIVEALKGPRKALCEERIRKIQQDQKTLLSRMDSILKNLMQRASPELSEHETKWFEELKRLKNEVLGSGRYDSGTLVSRTRLLEQEFERLMPSLKVLSEKEKKRKELSQTTGELGALQGLEFDERSMLEQAKISRIQQELLQLSQRLDVPLRRPPSPARLTISTSQKLKNHSSLKM